MAATIASLPKKQSIAFKVDTSGYTTESWRQQFFLIHGYGCKACATAFPKKTNPNVQPYEPLRAALMILDFTCAERLLAITPKEEVVKAFNLMIYKNKAVATAVDNWLRMLRDENPFCIPYDRIPQLK